MPVYILEMMNIPQRVRTAFEDGQFAVREVAGPFNGIWSDMGTEETVIRDSKNEWGIVGLAFKKPALMRWTLIRRITAEYAEGMKKRSGLTDNQDSKVCH
jgi:hypothetical protein